MNIPPFLVSMLFAPILGQAAGGLAEGASKAMGIVMLIGFIFGTICVVGGGFAIRRGDSRGRTRSSGGRASVPPGIPILNLWTKE